MTLLHLCAVKVTKNLIKGAYRAEQAANGLAEKPCGGCDGNFTDYLVNNNENYYQSLSGLI
jgi:hypothetical protein